MTDILYEVVEEDWQAWNAYPNQRWVFNKLEVSSKLGYHCGPAGVPVQRKGHYVVRPIYNLYGMGIGARKVYLDPEKDHDNMIAHMHVPPGYFWCEWLDGPHFSTDYIKKNDKWQPFSQMVGKHEDDNNLVKFKYWKVLNPEQNLFNLPDWIHKLNTQEYLNIESKGSCIIEIHLRSGNDNIWDYKPDTMVYPVWEGDDYAEFKHLKFVGNMHSDSFKYAADNHLSNIRLGYYIDEKI